MVKKSQPGREKQIASAFLLSYPQLFVWALIFAFIGGITVWSGYALTGADRQGSINLRLVTDNNGDGQPNRGDTITFDVASREGINPVLKLSCYQNGTNVLNTQKSYGQNLPTSQTRYIALTSAQWQVQPADCKAGLLDLNSSQADTIATYNFHVNP